MRNTDTTDCIPSEETGSTRNFELELLVFADSVRYTLGDFAHTSNKDLLDSNQLHTIYEAASSIVADITDRGYDQEPCLSPDVKSPNAVSVSKPNLP